MEGYSQQDFHGLHYFISRKKKKKTQLTIEIGQLPSIFALFFFFWSKGLKGQKIITIQHTMYEKGGKKYD